MNQNIDFDDWSLKSLGGLFLAQLIAVYVLFYVFGMLTAGRIVTYALLAGAVLWWSQGGRRDGHS